MAGDADDVIDLERRRCAAIGAGDLTALPGSWPMTISM